MSPPETSGQPDVRKSGHGEILAQLTRSLNLPLDGLSFSLVDFVRYFSLPLDPALLSKLRREALSLKMPRESAALAASAAADKGVDLTPEALKHYAAAIDPDAGGKQGDMDSPENKSGQEHGDLPEDDAGCVPLSGLIDAERLSKTCTEIEENDPLLNILNKMPGTDGEHWIVYPFQVLSGGKQIRVSVRIMAGQGKDAVRLAVDIAGGDRRWLFVMGPGQEKREDRPAGTPGNRLPEVRVSLWPPLSRREGEVMEREIRETLGPLASRVILRNYESFLSDCKSEVLPSVNEEV
jgi:hypothetical protein